MVIHCSIFSIDYKNFVVKIVTKISYQIEVFDIVTSGVSVMFPMNKMDFLSSFYHENTEDQLLLCYLLSNNKKKQDSTKILLATKQKDKNNIVCNMKLGSECVEFMALGQNEEEDSSDDEKDQ